MPDEDKPAPLRPAPPARSRLRAVAPPQPEPEEPAEEQAPEDGPEGEAGAAPPPRLVDRIHQLAVRIEEESTAVRDQQAAQEQASDVPARAVREATAKHAEEAARRVAEAATRAGKHEAPEPLPPPPLPPEDVEDDERSAGDAALREAPVAAAPPDEVAEDRVAPAEAAAPPDEERAPDEVAPSPVTAVATTAPAKKAPAKKAPAKKALAKKAAAKAPAKKAAAKAPAKKATTARKAPAKAVAAAAAASEAVAEATTAVPVPTGPPVAVPADAGAMTEEPRRGEPAPPPRPRQRPAIAAMSDTEVAPRPRPVAPPPRVLPTTVLPEEPGSRGVRVLVRLMVLLLAVAAGLGVAAYVESGEETWRSRIVIRLVPGAAPTVDATTAVRTGVDRYSRRVPDLTMTAAEIMGVRDEDVRSPISATQLDDDTIGITAEAAKGDQAQLLAGAAATELIRIVEREEKTSAATPTDRLTAVLSGPVSKPERTRPDDVVAALAGALTTLAVLLLAGLVPLVRRARS